jgi:dynein heavy chain
LKADLKGTQDKKASLEAQVEDCEAKLIRAESLITGLGGEKTRWKQLSEDLGVVDSKNIGDVHI